MKALILTIPLLFCSCEADYTAREQAQVVALEELLEDATPEERIEIEESLASIEASSLRGQYGPIVTGLGAVHPYLGMASPLLLGLVPLLGRRGRKLFGDILGHLNPFGREDDGRRRPAPIQAFLSLLKMLGMLHSGDGPTV